MSELVRLEATGVRYFSSLDEGAFFSWLKAIRSIVNVVGEGRSLYITIDREKLDDDGLRELLGLYRRYGIDRGQLKTFDCDVFAPWFRDPEASWFDEVFGRAG